MLYLCVFVLPGRWKTLLNGMTSCWNDSKMPSKSKFCGVTWHSNLTLWAYCFWWSYTLKVPPLLLGVPPKKCLLCAPNLSATATVRYLVLAQEPPKIASGQALLTPGSRCHPGGSTSSRFQGCQAKPGGIFCSESQKASKKKILTSGLHLSSPKYSDSVQRDMWTTQ